MEKLAEKKAANRGGKKNPSNRHQTFQVRTVNVAERRIR